MWLFKIKTYLKFQPIKKHNCPLATIMNLKTRTISRKDHTKTSAAKFNKVMPVLRKK
jgi:hypothetical protein